MRSILINTLLMMAMSFVRTNAQTIDTKNTIRILSTDSKESIISKAAHVVPTTNQYNALKNEFIAFIHFGPNTFTRMEWGNGMEDPSVFALQNLDTDQWCEAMVAAGMKMVIFTAKHHDGFCLWQSRYTKHGIMSSPFENGQGDILKSLSASCEKYGLKLGVYLSPADLYQIENEEGLYGNLSKYTERTIPRPVDSRPFENKTTFSFVVDDYNEYMLNQLFELLTEYGTIHEVWFDGAHPKRKGGQTYNYAAWKELIQTLAPEAVIFGRQDVRWCGNESGGTRKSEWNIIPYKEDPNKMNRFDDITGDPIAERAQLYKANFLHYQPAETNTSIREGWFYRDDHDQKVRNADDVFDIYERAVGGNSIFLLNIPPNRNGRFSDEDVAVLTETGKRIKETYGQNLFAKATGVQEVLDDDNSTFKLIDEKGQSLEINCPQAVTINRLVLQEAIRTHSERIEKFSIEAWINNGWTEVAQSTNVGYKRIVRFPETTSSKFRINILEFRDFPAISNISAHYYSSRPPQLTIKRDIGGMVTIDIREHAFNWKSHGENTAKNLNMDMKIRYTTDGSAPTENSEIYGDAFFFPGGEVKACVFLSNEKGSVASAQFGIVKENWDVLGSSGDQEKHAAQMAVDGDKDSYWHSKANSHGNHFIEIDLGKKYQLNGLIYTPQTEHSNGMIQKGQVMVSKNGKTWKLHEDFIFGNLINDPTSRKHHFNKSVSTRFIKIVSLEIANNEKTATIAELDFIQ
ncbi:alpha-L-fucosidase [Flexithrix dorotheae]|uniref:alpha-L-fucosidase n=1 Tax=Flexithrix dorotheae TaxID=70993 RepID=UPI000476D664|nr:alpha-L-fucosidase [Flexithrix dorotheae]